MARPIRIEFSGAVYHVMARGNERRAIFRDDRDRERFLETLALAVEQYGWQLHAYCLMGNHYHMLVGTPRANLSRGMGWLQATYTARFNARHRRRGHLFAGRYKAQIVEADEYARWLVEYLHLNPVRPVNKRQPLDPARQEELKRYRWSSHGDYAGSVAHHPLGYASNGSAIGAGPGVKQSLNIEKPSAKPSGAAAAAPGNKCDGD